MSECAGPVAGPPHDGAEHRPLAPKPAAEAPIPPHNLDAERAVLGAILLEGRDSFARVADTLEGDDFYTERHREIFKAMCALAARRERIDVLTLAEELRRADQLEAVGGPVALGLLMEHASILINLPSYVRLVTEAARRREFCQLGERLCDGAINGATAADLSMWAGELLAQQRARTAVAPPPTFHASGDEYALRWTTDDGRDAAIVLSAVREHRDGLHAEYTVTLGDHDPVWGRLGLASTQARAGLVNTLKALDPTIDWRSRLDRACRETAMTARRGSPAVAVTPQLASSEAYLIDPIVPQGETATIAGDGGSGKTTLALVLALAALNGAPLPGGINATRRIAAALFLDYETTQATVEELVCLICRAHGWDAARLYYKAMTGPLVDVLSTVKTDVIQLGVELIVVDSQAPASGVDPEGANAAVAFHTALRSLGPAVTRLVTAHVNAITAAQTRGVGRPFGSVFNTNLPRSVWELRRSNEDAADDMQVALFHRKVNRGRRHAPIALGFAFEPNRLTIHGAHLGESPDLRARASLQVQIRTALSNGTKSVLALATELNAKPDVVRSTLHKMKAKGVVLQVPSTNLQQQWGLASR
jgi:DnaB-like helicase N terminal domain/AAA domain